ncbi:hypothetical protein [Halolamina rubra]|uniref:hypothetical protein n=1 Tax=Halolamina rubra TaxID=1380430 RepID=UPI0012AC0B15|nr:hypothetical protein [Halolamina rubra]
MYRADPCPRLDANYDPSERVDDWTVSTPVSTAEAIDDGETGPHGDALVAAPTASSR